MFADEVDSGAGRKTFVEAEHEAGAENSPGLKIIPKTSA
jgi:hypothetical protein